MVVLCICDQELAQKIGKTFKAAKEAHRFHRFHRCEMYDHPRGPIKLARYRRD